MPAHNSTFPWLSYYGHYNFFEERMFDHSKVSSIEQINTGLYDVHLTDGPILRVFICECYAFGDADYHETVGNYGPVNAVIISSNWCGYDFDTKLARMKEKVGIFDIKGFMAAITKPNYWEYMTEHERNILKRSQAS
ncbi:MAG: hypothetical protein D9V46_03250 [Deltaproteobacteria bacterium]|uniref:hypothetical protein n=1 Tax=Hydrosulfovibrio ferrireducens TaxID=2934181 RepID=UPI00121D99C3|nr:MAG: hypothetical protein D9V46_03250 [Deltaproteobacteria bacterium]